MQRLQGKNVITNKPKQKINLNIKENDKESDIDDIDGESLHENKKKSKILFVEDITIDITEKLLEQVFNNFDGYKTLRLMQNKYAVVEFENENQAEKALEKTNLMRLTQTCKIKVSFSN